MNNYECRLDPKSYLMRYDYPRVLRFNLPEEAKEEFKTGDYEISYRAFLTWAAENDPVNAPKLLAIRDAYYGGDNYDDHVLGFGELGPLSLTMRDRAMLRRERDRISSYREIRHRQIVADFESARAHRADVLNAFADEFSELDQKFATLEAHYEELVRDWEYFIAKWGSDLSGTALEWEEECELQEREMALRLHENELLTLRIDLEQRALAQFPRNEKGTFTFLPRVN